MKFSMRIDDLEARSCNEYLLQDKEHNRIELIRWQSTENITITSKKEVSYTIAFYKPTKDNWDLVCLPERYIEIIQNKKLQKIFNILTTTAYEYLLSLKEEEDV